MPERTLRIASSPTQDGFLPWLTIVGGSDVKVRISGTGSAETRMSGRFSPSPFNAEMRFFCQSAVNLGVVDEVSQGDCDAIVLDRPAVWLLQSIIESLREPKIAVLTRPTASRRPRRDS